MENTAAFLSALDEAMLPSGSGVVLDVASLKTVFRRNDMDKVAALISSRNISVLLLVTSIDESADRFLQALTRGVVLKSIPAGAAARINFAGSGGMAGELASHSYPRRQIEAIGLSLGSGSDADCIMKLDEFPAFVRVRSSDATVFVWSSIRVFDILRPLTEEREFEEAADEYIPAIIFLRSVSGDKCWYNPIPHAGLVIDDPLLVRRYGFINFPELLASARKHGYHVTLGFIPWNYWRSRQRSVQKFLDHTDCFSICVHGCDHTRNEFRSVDYQDLLGRNFAASERMDRHEQRTGIPWEPLMVCPQEQYSLEGLRAFSDSRQFLALVNTACMPREGSANRLCGTDLLRPAQDSFFGFPVFKRHYWSGRMADFAMSLFLGKPAILVEHHEFFRNGPAGIEDFVARLKEINPRVKWNSLSETVIQTHLRRRDEDRHCEIRFFTDRFQFKHELGQLPEYRLTRRVPATTNVQRVVVNQKEVPFMQEYDQLNFQIRITEPQIVNVEIGVNPIQPAKAYACGLKCRTRVAARRALSELRDNFVARNRFLLQAARSLMRSLKQTGGE